MNYIQIAIDGPAGAGKSTIAKLIAKELNYVYIDTGAMYRAITLKAIKQNINLQDEEAFKAILDTKFQFIDGHLHMDDIDVSDQIRTHKVSNNVSLVSSYLSVRKQCVKIQREIAQSNNIVMDGRDIGYKVLPNADFKFFLTASIEERAQRRYKDNKKRGIKSDFEILKQKIAERDHLDSTREHSPLKPANDAIILDTSHLSIEQVVETITNTIKRGRE